MYTIGEEDILLFITNKGGLDAIVRDLGATSLEKDENGAPYLVGAPYAVSLSHKGDIVAFAVSRHAVGVDVEDTTVPRNVERLSKIFHVQEKPTSLYDFYKVWTAKESEGKRMKCGITADILRSETPEGKYFDWGDYLVCVMGDGTVQVIDR